LHASTNEPVLDADFDRVLDELYSSTIVDAFDWLADGVSGAASAGGWVVQASEIAVREDLCLDPKRWSQKHSEVTAAIKAIDHLAVGEVIRPVTRKLAKAAGTIYRYVEIEKIYENFGSYIAADYFGWALPDRGRLVAAPGDI